jgi:hypothetical protein
MEYLEPKESQPPEAANKSEEAQPNNQAKDNANDKEQKQASTKSAGKDIAEVRGSKARRQQRCSEEQPAHLK